VSLGNVALDGTKVKANASKHKAMSHERMLKSEGQLEAEAAGSAKGRKQSRQNRNHHCSTSRQVTDFQSAT
jgi:hypothetical protein